MKCILYKAAVAIFTLMAGATMAQEQRNFLITFGDSYSKTGFDPAHPAQPRPGNPLGNPSYPGVTSSGGANWVGYMMTEFNNSIAYSRNTQTVSYNFARSGATVNNNLIQGTGHDFLKQVDMFTQYYRAGPGSRGWKATNAVVGVWFGVNDLRTTFFGNGEEQLLVQVMDSYFQQLDKLYSLGLRKYLLFTAAPFNMAPNFQNLHDKRARTLRSRIHTWDNLLRSGLERFERKHGDVAVEIVESSVPFQKAFQYYASLGVQDTRCSNLDGVSCLWWDGLHPATKIMRLVAAEAARVLQGNTYRCYPRGCN